MYVHYVQSILEKTDKSWKKTVNSELGVSLLFYMFMNVQCSFLCVLYDNFIMYFTEK